MAISLAPPEMQPI